MLTADGASPPRNPLVTHLREKAEEARLRHAEGRRTSPLLRVIELGCGPGTLVDAMVAAEVTKLDCLVLADQSEVMRNAALAKAQRVITAERGIHALIADMRNVNTAGLGLADRIGTDGFDLVIAANSILFPDRRDVVRTFKACRDLAGLFGRCTVHPAFVRHHRIPGTAVVRLRLEEERQQRPSRAARGARLPRQQAARTRTPAVRRRRTAPAGLPRAAHLHRRTESRRLPADRAGTGVLRMGPVQALRLRPFPGSRSAACVAARRSGRATRGRRPARTAAPLGRHAAEGKYGTGSSAPADRSHHFTRGQHT
jgi:SAM-dependent methyltransferase